MATILKEKEEMIHEKRFEGDISRLRSPERVERLEVKRVVDLCLENEQAGSVLDVGTGTGLFAEAFARHDLTIAGVDVNPEMLASARVFVPKGEFRTGIAEALPYPDKSFDLVILGLVLHETDDSLKALKEALRVARKRVSLLEWPYRDQSFGPPLAHRLNPEDLAGLFKKAGFRKWQRTDLSDTVLYLLDV
jgi:ubiquinone/menaquinone biosynthesis C-methylase UbiE